jgi:hypothetical protein
MPENIYQSTAHGQQRSKPATKRGERLVSKKDIAKVFDGNTKCCESGHCLSLWMDDMEREEAEAIVATERGAYAAMGETARRVHYMKWLKQIRVPQYTTSINGKKVLTGEELHITQLMLCIPGYDANASGCLLAAPSGYKIDRQRLTVHTTRPLCQKAFCMITGVGLRSLQTYTALVEQGIEPNSLAGRRQGDAMAKTEMARAWLNHYANLHDSLPNKSQRGVTEVGRHDWVGICLCGLDHLLKRFLLLEHAGSPGCDEETGCVLPVLQLHD